MNDTKKGMLFIMMAAFFFASMNVFVKLSGDLSSIQKSFFRNMEKKYPKVLELALNFLNR